MFSSRHSPKHCAMNTHPREVGCNGNVIILKLQMNDEWGDGAAWCSWQFTVKTQPSEAASDTLTLLLCLWDRVCWDLGKYLSPFVLLLAYLLCTDVTPHFIVFPHHLFCRNGRRVLPPSPSSPPPSSSYLPCCLASPSSFSLLIPPYRIFVSCLNSLLQQEGWQ